MSELGGGLKYTFGNSKAAVNLVVDILPQYPEVQERAYRLLSKQFSALTAVSTISDRGIRRATLLMWHNQFATSLGGLPEIVKSHIRCVETGKYRELLRESKKEVKSEPATI